MPVVFWWLSPPGLEFCQKSLLSTPVVMKKREPTHDKTNKVTVCPATTQLSLGIRPVWSESSLCPQWVAKDPSFLHAESEDSDQIGRMPRLIWIFAGRTCQFVGFVTRRLIYDCFKCAFLLLLELKTLEYYCVSLCVFCRNLIGIVELL